MRIARVRHLGKTSTAIVKGRSVQLVRGGPFGRLAPTGERAPLSKVQLLAPVRPSKIVAIGVNYRSHAGERTAPTEPQAFLKAPSSLIGPGQPILLPEGAGRVDEEAEVVAVIGRRARNLSEAEVESLMAAAKARPGRDGLRLVALLEILYATGLRVSELVSLPVYALSRDGQMLVVRGPP